MSKRLFFILGVVAVIGILAIPFWALSKRGEESAAAMPIASSDRTAQHLFQTNCGACHTLAAGGTDGVVAPNLDVLLATGPESASAVDANCLRVLNDIDHGLGGRMPAGILQGANADLVASFVARSVAYVNTTSSPSASNEVPASKVNCKPPSTAAAAKPSGAKPSGGKAAKAGGAKPTPSAAAPSALSVAADPTGQLKYEQTSLSAKAGKVTIDFTNQSPIMHNVNIADSSGKVLGATQTITGGKTSTSLNLKPGKYTFFCSVDSHEQAGMKGTLTVR